MELERFLRKASRILRNHYRKVTLQTVRVRINGDEFYDVFITNEYGSMIYMDCLDGEKLNLLVRALNILCDVQHRSDLLDGFYIVFNDCMEESK